MTALTAPLPGRTAEPPPRALVRTAGAALVLSGAWALVDELDDRLQRDIAHTAYFKSMTLTSLVAFGLLAVAAAALLRTPAAGSSRVVRAVVALGLLQAVCAQWYVAFVTPLLADVAPESVNTDEGWVGAGLGAALLSAAVALVVLGVAVLRAKVLPRSAGWFLVVSGIALVVVPGGQLTAGIGLLLATTGDD